MLNVLLIFLIGSAVGFLFGVTWVFTKKPDAIIGVNPENQVKLIFCKPMNEIPDKSKILLEVRNIEAIAQNWEERKSK